jgi:hypothetical protein
MSKQQLKNKIADLKQWLTDNSPEHEARPSIEADLRRAIDELNSLSNHRTFERDTFDLREHNFTPADGK